jgi:hypothetical protein
MERRALIRHVADEVSPPTDGLAAAFRAGFQAQKNPEKTGTRAGHFGDKTQNAIRKACRPSLVIKRRS